MFGKVDCSLKERVVAIGGLHSVLLVYGIFATIRDMILEEQPVTEGEILYILGHVSLHVFLIVTLVTGATQSYPLLILPWLIVTFPVFAVVSFYTLKYSHLSFLLQFVFNIVFICFSWFLWLTVCQFYKNSKKLGTWDTKILKPQFNI